MQWEGDGQARVPQTEQQAMHTLIQTQRRIQAHTHGNSHTDNHSGEVASFCSPKHQRRPQHKNHIYFWHRKLSKHKKKIFIALIPHIFSAGHYRVFLYPITIKKGSIKLVAGIKAQRDGFPLLIYARNFCNQIAGNWIYEKQRDKHDV